MFKEITEDKILPIGLFAISAYYANSKFMKTHKFNPFFTLLLFFISIIYTFTISPYLEKKFNIRKLANYHRRRGNLIKAIITLTPFYLICYLLSRFVDITEIINKLSSI